MITTSNNYTDRTLDLEFLQTIDPNREVQMSYTLAQGGVSRFVTGPQKAAQRYVRWYLDLRGSGRFDPDMGTYFMQRMLRGQGGRRGLVVHQFALSNVWILGELEREDVEFGAPPDDERIDSVKLADFEVDYVTATLTLHLNIKFQSGDTLELILPAERLP